MGSVSCGGYQAAFDQIQFGVGKIYAGIAFRARQQLQTDDKAGDCLALWDLSWKLLVVLVKAVVDGHDARKADLINAKETFAGKATT